MDNYKFNSIVNRATVLVFWTPALPWAWAKLAEPLKVLPIAFQQLFSGEKTVASRLLPFGLLILLASVNVF